MINTGIAATYTSSIVSHSSLNSNLAQHMSTVIKIFIKVAMFGKLSNIFKGVFSDVMLSAFNSIKALLNHDHARV